MKIVGVPEDDRLEVLVQGQVLIRFHAHHPKPDDNVLLAFHILGDPLLPFAEGMGHGSLVEIPLVLHIEVEVPLGHAEFAGDILEGGLLEPVPCEDPQRGLENPDRLFLPVHDRLDL